MNLFERFEAYAREESRCRQVLEVQPADASAHWKLGAALAAQGRLPEAILCFQRCLQLDPNDAQAHLDLADALSSLGGVVEARSHIKAALEISPGSAPALCAAARHGLTGEADVSVERLKALLAAPGLSPVDAMLVYYTLGELLDRSRDYDQAFAHYRHANDLQRSEFLRNRQGFSAADLTNHVNGIMRVFTPEFFRKMTAAGTDSELPIFIVGMPRSGTTLVEQILASHPQVFGAGEIPGVPMMLHSLPPALWQFPECVRHFRAAAQEYVAGLRARGGPALRVTDKALDNFLHLGLIATVFPRARIIYCRRDPLDVCLSCYFLSQGPNFACDFQDLAHYFRQYERLMAYWRTILPVPIFEVVYEELVADTTRVSRELVAFCGVGWDERCLRFHETRREVHTASKLQVRQPIYQHSVGRWRHYAAHLRPLQEALGP